MFLTKRNNKKGLVPRSLARPANPPAGGVVGFTLIELLVVIVIIGILATLATVALTSSRANARDARRISDLKQISLALELYQADNNSYPTVITPGSALTNSTNTKTYIAKVPSNPAPRAEGACGDSEYQYAGSASDYSLIGCLAKGTGDASAGARVVSIAGARNLGPTNGIVGWWLMDSNYLTNDNKVVDLSGNANHGAINGGATLTANQIGMANKAYSFSNASHIITMPTSGMIFTDKITLSGWAKIGASQTIYPRLFGIENVAILLIRGDAVGQLRFFGSSIDAPFAPSSIDLRDNKWHFIVCTYNGSNILAYIDGVYIGSIVLSGNLANIGGNLFTIGNRSGLDRYLNGSISDTRIYNRALSQDEVAALWNATRP